MTQIMIELEPETEAAVQAQARARGVDVREFLRSLVTQATRTRPLQRPSLEQFDRDWEAFCEGIEGLPPLGPEAFTREAIYADHD